MGSSHFIQISKTQIIIFARTRNNTNFVDKVFVINLEKNTFLKGFFLKEMFLHLVNMVRIVFKLLIENRQ